MSLRNTLTAVFVVGGLAFAAGRVFSDDTTGRKMPSKEEMTKMMEEFARPVEQHAKLAADVGTWDADVTCWMDPSQPPMTSKGTNTATSTLGGLWLDEKFNGVVDGKPFEGRTLVGYSKEKQKYFGIWISSMGSTPEIVWGTPDATGDVITFDGDPVPCPLGTFTPRWVVRRGDADHMTFEHWSKKDGDSDYAKGMEIKYARRK